MKVRNIALKNDRKLLAIGENDRRKNASSRVIGLAAKVGIHQIRAFGMRWIAIRWLESHKDGINFSENLGIVALEDPPALRFVVGVENAEPLDLFVAAFLLGPYSVFEVRLLHLGFAQVVGVKDQRLAFGEKD